MTLVTIAGGRPRRDSVMTQEIRAVTLGPEAAVIKPGSEAPIRPSGMAGRTRRRHRLTPMTIHTLRHGGQMRPGGRPHLREVAMTGGALDAGLPMPAVIEVKGGRWKLNGRRPRGDLSSISPLHHHGAVAGVAAIARVDVVHPVTMTLGADRLRGQETIGGGRGARGEVTAFAGRGPMSAVGELQRDRLRWIDHRSGKPEGHH